MIFSEDNYGRFEATQLALHWMVVGAGAMFLLFDIASMLDYGIETLRTAVSVIAFGILVWQLRAALLQLREVRQILRSHDYSPVPTSVFVIVVGISLLIGAAAIFVYRDIVLDYLEGLAVPYARIAGPIVSALVLGLISILSAAFLAWFIVYPKVPKERA